jgi:predicted SAM-dependent methyltransferase
MKLNLGCGHIQPADWVNVDGSNRAWLASTFPRLDRLAVKARLFSATEFNGRTVYANLLKGFVWTDASVEAIYMGEILEHFTLEQGAHVLRECQRILKSAGRIRIRVPDLARFWGNYIDQYRSTKTRPREEWTLEHARWTRMYFANICVERPKPWQSMGHFHKWMYDEVTLIIAVQTAGFVHAERRAFRDSDIRGIEDVEARDDLIVEAVG